MPSPAASRRRRPEIGEPGGLLRAVRDDHPRFAAALRADVEAALRYRSERRPLRTRAEVAREALRLAVVGDTFLAQCCYRAKAAAQRRGIPLLPRLLHHMAIARGGICIGDPVSVEPGVYIPHGQVVVDGFTRIGAGTVLSPFVTVGLRAGHPVGPTLGANVYLGTGAKVFGPVTLGAGAKVGANAVVTGDVPPGATAVGVPARTVD
jgi:serine O-acetyltransferase